MWTLLVTALITASVADIGSTEYALRHGQGLREGNPVMAGSTARRVVLKASAVTGELVVLSKLRKDHPKLTVVLGIGLSALPAIATIHNLRSR